MIKINKRYALASAIFALLLSLAPATLQAHDLIICKASDATSPVTGSFRFHVLGTGFVDVAVGSCITLVAIGEGSHTIVEESTEGTEVTKIDVSPSADKVSSDLGARTAVVTLSDVTGPTTLTYTNGAVGCGRYTGGGSIFTSGGV